MRIAKSLATGCGVVLVFFAVMCTLSSVGAWVMMAAPHGGPTLFEVIADGWVGLKSLRVW